MEKNKEQKIPTPAPEFKTIRVFVEGRNYKTTYTKKFEERKSWVPPNPEELKSFLPGTVDKIIVKPGDEVKQGDILMTFIAMKMHNLVRAPFNGKISAINVKAGDKVPKGMVMIVVAKAKEKAPKGGKVKESPRERRQARRRK